MNRNFLLDCYLSLLEKNYAPQFKGEHITFRYNDLPIIISRDYEKRNSYTFSICNVADTEKKNKAIIYRFFQDTHYETNHPVKMRIERDETVTIYLITVGFSYSNSLNSHIDYLCEILAETYDVFIEMVIRRYGCE